MGNQNLTSENYRNQYVAPVVRPYKQLFGAQENEPGAVGGIDDAFEENEQVDTGIINPQISLPVPEAEA